MYIFNRRQDEELDALSASVQRIEGVGLTIHDELVGQVFPSCMCNNSYGHPLPRLVIPFFMQKCIFYCIFIKLSNPSSCQYLRSVSHCSGEAFGWAEPRDGNYFKSARLCAGLYLLLHLNTICHEPSSSFPPHFLNSSACISWNCMFAKVVSV